MGKTYKDHPAAGMFPMLPAKELDELAADISARGQLEPIVVYQGKILDGRNRYRACEKAGVTAMANELVSLPGGRSPEEYVASANLHRRHLNESQRALIGARIKKKLATTHGGKRTKGQEPNLALEVDNARERAARAVNVSHGSIASAEKVLDHGHRDLIAAVERGDVSVSKAAKIAEQPERLQKHAVKSHVSHVKGSRKSAKRRGAAIRNSASRKKRLKAVDTDEPPIVVASPVPIRQVGLRDILKVAKDMETQAPSMGPHTETVLGWASELRSLCRTLKK